MRVVHIGLLIIIYSLANAACSGRRVNLAAVSPKKPPAEVASPSDTTSLTLTCLPPEKVASGTVYKCPDGRDLVGSFVDKISESPTDSGTPPTTYVPCTEDGQVDCIATPNFRAVDMTKLIPGNLKSGVVIAGQTGTYPSLLNPLPGASGDDLPGLLASVPAGTYQWWKQDGTRVTGTITDLGTISPTGVAQTFNTSVYRQFTISGDSQLREENIRLGIRIFGVDGNASLPSACTGDNQTNCLATARFKTVDTQAITGWDVRAGKTVAGIVGGLRYCRNTINTDIFGTAGSPSSTIDNLNAGNAGLPPTSVTGWANHVCGTVNWQDISSSGTRCSVGGGSGDDMCMMRDNLTGTIWSPMQPNVNGVALAQANCQSLAWGDRGAGTWRLPTQLELLQASINGIRQFEGAHFIPSMADYYWSSTRDSANPSDTWLIQLSSGHTLLGLNPTKPFVCVTP